VIGQKRDPLHDLAPSEVGDCGVRGDPIEPGFEGQVRPGAGQRIVGLDEGVLREVLRQGPVIHHPVQIIQDRSVVLLEEPREGHLVSGPGATYEVRILCRHHPTPRRIVGRNDDPMQSKLHGSDETPFPPPNAPPEAFVSPRKAAVIGM
jgi:hypothetical protein